MIAVGIICAFMIGCFLAKRSGLDDDALFSMGLVGIVGGIIGAKLLYYIVEFPSILADPSILLNFGEGFVVYGGLIAGFLSPLILHQNKEAFLLTYIDCAVPGVAFAQGCGRIGCFLAGLDRIISARMQGRVGPPLCSLLRRAQALREGARLRELRGGCLRGLRAAVRAHRRRHRPDLLLRRAP